MADNEADGVSVIDRRRLIKRAAAAGAAAWTAPLISGSLASPAAAMTLPSLCFKYQHNWAPTATSGSLVECYNRKTDGTNTGAFDQTWTDNCAESHPTLRRAGQATAVTASADRYDSNACHPGKNCCSPNEGNDDWHEGNPDGSEVVPTFPNPECVSSVPACPAVQVGYNNGQNITFNIDRSASACPGCYFADGVIAYTSDPSVCPGTPTSLSLSCSQFASSEFFNSVRFNFNGSTLQYPIYFKFWIACNLKWNVGSYVPFTQCDIPTGQPGANPGHDITGGVLIIDIG